MKRARIPYQDWQMGDPGKIKPWQWMLWAVIQVACTWGAIAAYHSMKHGGYWAGYWALIVSVPLVGFPLLYGLGLFQGAHAHAMFLRRERTSYRPAAGPLCDICHERTCSWNTRLKDWAETCSQCRDPNYFDNDNMVG